MPENQNAIAALLPELIAIRRDIHRHPETGFEERRTAAIVAERLESWGIEVTRGLAGTGVVGTIRGARPGNRAIGLRADMDALPISEATGLPWASEVPGKMHACGHDGHTAMLLGAARILAARRDFAGTVQVIFQPAEEILGGGRRMVEEGLFERFHVDAVYGMHNEPGLPLGQFALRPGPMLAIADGWQVVLRGSGGHGAVPHRATDPTVALGHLILGLQTIIGRNVPVTEAGVISIGHIAAGDPRAGAVIPAEVTLRGTARCYTPEVRAVLEARLRALAESFAAAQGCRAEVAWMAGYPAVVNAPAQTEIAMAAAGRVGAVDPAFPPLMAAEDFAYMLQARPGAFILLGNGRAEDGSFHHVHTPMFDFNDAAIPYGVGYWLSLVAQELGG